MRIQRIHRARRLTRRATRRPGGAGGLVGLVAFDTLEISAAATFAWDFSSYAPEAGDLMVISSHQGNSVAGAGGVSSSGWTEVTSRDSVGRLLHKVLGASETTVTFDSSPSYRLIHFGLFRGGYTVANALYNQVSLVAGASRTTTTCTLPSKSLPVGSYYFCDVKGGSSAWASPPGSVAPTVDNFEGVFTATGFDGSVQSAIYPGTGAAIQPVFTHTSNFSFDTTGSLNASLCEVVPA